MAKFAEVGENAPRRTSWDSAAAGKGNGETLIVLRDTRRTVEQSEQRQEQSLRLLGARAGKGVAPATRGPAHILPVGAADRGLQGTSAQLRLQW